MLAFRLVTVIFGRSDRRRSRRRGMLLRILFSAILLALLSRISCSSVFFLLEKSLPSLRTLDESYDDLPDLLLR
jgi:hypothetical protein